MKTKVKDFIESIFDSNIAVQISTLKKLFMHCDANGQLHFESLYYDCEKNKNNYVEFYNQIDIYLDDEEIDQIAVKYGHLYKDAYGDYYTFEALCYEYDYRVQTEQIQPSSLNDYIKEYYEILK